jgi:hypothetical protein
MPLAQLVHRLATDSAFAARALDDPRAALTSSGLEVDEEGIQALLGLLHDRARWQRLCSPSQVIPEDLPWQSAQFDPPATN